MEALELSKYIVSKCVEDNKPISNLQLQKILYYIQYEFLKEMDITLFSDDIEAWQFGPVVSSVYYHFCGFGSMQINTLFKGYKEIIKDDRIRKLLDKIIEDKRKRDPWDMVKDTHREKGPWSLTYKNGKGLRNVISINMIKSDIKKRV